MTKRSAAAETSVRAMGAEELKALRGARIRAVLFALFSLAAFAAASANGATVANLSLWLDKIGGTDLLIAFPVSIVWIAAGLVLGAVAAIQYRRGGGYRWRIGFAAASPLLVLAIFTTLLSGTPANLTVLFTGTFNYAGPVAIGALAGIISERSGILNIAIEGKFLLGALAGAVASSIFGVAVAGPIAGALLGALVGLLLALLGLRYKVDQIVAGTVINLGAAGITVVETPVGDRHVVAAMQEHGAVLGGEQSGHIVFARHATTGDGTLTGLLLADLVHRSARPLSAHAAQMPRFPQRLVNVRIAPGRALAEAPRTRTAVAEAEAELGADGRVLVRASGTEPLLRIMVEAADAERATVVVERLRAVAEAELGLPVEP